MGAGVSRPGARSAVNDGPAPMPRTRGGSPAALRGARRKTDVARDSSDVLDVPAYRKLSEL